jgi:Fatty acid hydroxylase superfamily
MSEIPSPMGALLPEASIHERRRKAIVDQIPSWYRPTPHFVIPSLIGLAALIFGAVSVHALRPIELLAIPLTLLAAFGFEWRVHKWVLHKRMPGLGLLYERHELHHHVIYTYEDIVLRSSREMYLILMPAYAVVLIGLINAPIAYGLSFLFSANVAYIYLVTSMVFFLAYEWLHLAYHLPPAHPIGRLPFIARLREHHRRHHDPRLMKAWNFNVSLPLFDWIYRTTWTPEREAARAAKASARGRPPQPIQQTQ